MSRYKFTARINVMIALSPHRGGHSYPMRVAFHDGNGQEIPFYSTINSTTPLVQPISYNASEISVWTERSGLTKATFWWTGSDGQERSFAEEFTLPSNPDRDSFLADPVAWVKEHNHPELSPEDAQIVLAALPRTLKPWAHYFPGSLRDLKGRVIEWYKDWYGNE